MIDRATQGEKTRDHPGNGATTLVAGGFDRQRELADFMRQTRARITPEQVGLPPASGHRRTPGLRREELAALAGISVDWYIRLEQGRGERPSPSVLDSLSSALRLSGDERAHLYALARGERPPLQTAPAEQVDPGMERLLRTLPEDAPAYVLGWRWDVLEWNRGACDLLVDFGTLAPARRNLVELMFLDEEMRGRYLDWEEVARLTLANFRAALARNIDQPEAKALVDHLQDSDPHFAAWWDLHEVQEKTSGVKRFRGPDGETTHWHFQSVLSPSSDDQRLIVYTPATGPDKAPPP
jgi:transcriptional regulator with XRE-family HTH domain